MNYLNHVRIGCDLLSLSSEAISNPAVRRAGIAIEKRQQFKRRARLFIQQNIVVRIIDCALRRDEQDFAMAVLTTYVFLLRMPSECLPIVTSNVGNTRDDDAVVSVQGGCITLELK